MKIVLLRLDKIGDLVSTLPVDQIPELQGHEVRWVISEGLGFVARASRPEREALEISLNEPKAAQKKLRAFLHQFQPDLAIMFYGPWWAAKTLWQARVPRRFGRRSQWFSYVFFNEGVRQSRSQADRHESAYNLELVLAALGAKIEDREAPILKLEARPQRHLFEKYNLKTGEYVVVHPGMAGSALNWPNENYIALIEELKKTTNVVLTGTKADEKYLAPIKAKFPHDPNVQSLQGLLDQQELLFILKSSAGVVAPSTGIVHLAASLGARTVGLYSPVRVHHPKRWGPRGADVQVLVPDSDADLENCMKQITVDQVLKCLK